jgi:hypothetical protein
MVERLNTHRIIRLTFEDWFRRGAYLSDLGINRKSAIAELKSRIPDAHLWYSEHGEAEWPGTVGNGVLIAPRNLQNRKEEASHEKEKVPDGPVNV